LGTFERRVSEWYSEIDAGIFSKPALQFYRAAHYHRSFSVGNAYQALRLIPEGAAVSAASQLVPHLAFRDYIYEFPHVGNATYIALLPNSLPWLPYEELEGKIASYRSSPDWRTIYEEGGVVILKRITAAGREGGVSFGR